MDGPPYQLSYQYRRKGNSHKKDWPVLQQMIKEKLVKVVQKTNKSILYEYHPGMKR